MLDLVASESVSGIAENIELSVYNTLKLHNNNNNNNNNNYCVCVCVCVCVCAHVT